MKGRRMWSLVLALILACTAAGSALAYREGTLYSGVKSEEVKKMQTALIKLGYLGGTPDGVFGTHTEKAVKAFQKANKMTADGVAGAKTLELIYKKAGMSSSGSSGSSSESSSANKTDTSSGGSSEKNTGNTSEKKTDTASNSAQNTSGLFSGNYATLRLGNTGNRVKTLQQRLIALGYLKGSADGKFGKSTRTAVVAFQKAAGLTADGLAGKKTLQALEKGSASGNSSSGNSSSGKESASENGSSGTPSSSRTASGPSGGQVRLMHWFDEVKPSLSNGQTLYIYEPKSGEGWNLRIYSCGRHCDAEPCTAEDTAAMLRAFGGSNTWSQKAVYVKLPSGKWTIGSTHDMPHLSGSIKDNNFNGHLCVHFLRTMSEAQKNDPSYGVSNQNTIRAFWKSLTGEEITD